MEECKVNAHRTETLVRELVGEHCGRVAIAIKYEGIPLSAQQPLRDELESFAQNVLIIMKEHA